MFLFLFLFLFLKLFVCDKELFKGTERGKDNSEETSSRCDYIMQTIRYR